VVVPALDSFAPELIIVPSGFDAGAYDPLGRMQMHSDGYRSLAEKLIAAAERHCNGRLLMTHEGGYNSWTVPFFGLAVMETLAGCRTGTEDPFLPLHAGLGGQDLQPHQQAAIDHAKPLLKALGEPEVNSGLVVNGGGPSADQPEALVPVRMLPGPVVLKVGQVILPRARPAMSGRLVVAHSTSANPKICLSRSPVRASNGIATKGWITLVH